MTQATSKDYRALETSRLKTVTLIKRKKKLSGLCLNLRLRRRWLI